MVPSSFFISFLTKNVHFCKMKLDTLAASVQLSVSLFAISSQCVVITDEKEVIFLTVFLSPYFAALSPQRQSSQVTIN